MSARGATLHLRVLNGWPHGFSAEGGWIVEIEECYDFMQQAFAGA